ncbi:Glycosyltransferase family 1 protein [Mycena chlorophos]|uniref:Glycosyltransferase family 1 protein n=1 Tax=Mycena chlorophos TaxID=658473 RepID=A0A8H6S273_MYCCL|nr:Glycosyltransferase family 1 protein [Mycena chlorophos]
MPSRAARHTPSSTPPKATSSPLSKKQRQRQQKEHNSAMATDSPYSSSPAMPSSPLASSPPVVAIELPQDRPSPSQYPTPLPDEDYDDGPALPVPAPIPAASVPEGALVDLGIEDEFVGGSDTMREEPRMMLAEPLIIQQRSAPVSDQPQQPQEPQEPPYPPTPQSSNTHHTAKGNRRRTSHHSPHVAYGQSSSEDGHMRSPQAPRSHATAPRALSALSAALRTVQAVTSTATAYASSGYANYQQVGDDRRISASSSQRHAYGHGTDLALRKEDEDEDEIVDARWAECAGSRLLVLAYSGGVQVWDATVLNSVKEVANLRVPTDAIKGPVLSATVLPVDKDGAELGILTPHAFCVYNLSLGRVVSSHTFRAVASPSAAALEAVKDEADANHRRRGSGDSIGRAGSLRERKLSARRAVEIEDAVGTPLRFEATDKIVLVTTHTPPALVILARTSLQVLHVIPSALLAVPLPPSSLGTNSSSSYGSPTASRVSASPRPTGLEHYAPLAPVAALNGRLLAFLAPPPETPAGVETPSTDGGITSWGRTLGRFFSRSAPAATSTAVNMLGGTPVGNAVLEASSNVLAAAGLSTPQGGAGSWIRVLDLAPLLHHQPSRDIHAFEAGRHAVGGLHFAADGTRLVVVRRDGLGAGVWGLRPGNENAGPVHLYKLRRGRTTAVIQTVAGSNDGRFIALSTQRRTIHVFAVNPYGGRADWRSHLTARVRDTEVGLAGLSPASVLQTDADGPPTNVHALVRMHLSRTSQQHSPDVDTVPPNPAPLAITFVPPSLATPISNPLRSPTSPMSPQPTGAQDVLVFDPVDGVLTLRRMTLSLETPTPHTMGVPLPVSMSLPTSRFMSSTSVSSSPPVHVGSYGRGGPQTASGSAHGSPNTNSTMTETVGAELAGKEVVLATWPLRRRKGWAEIRRADVGSVGADGRQQAGHKESWLSQAELSTFSSAPRALPRPIYLTHQFFFYTLGHDYHALIRRYQFSLRGAKIDVRKEVEVSGVLTGGGEAFVEGIAPSSSPRAIHRRSRTSQASFDEPLASALSGAQYALPPPVLPMLPNGMPSSSSFRGAIPIRAVAANLGDGVAEGIGRIRREMRHQRQRQLARSPPATRQQGDDLLEASVPLEFDEEDEDFIGVPAAAPPEAFLQVHAHADREEDDVSANTSPSRTGEDSVLTISTPATSAHPLEDEIDGGIMLDDGWTEDNLAVEEAERFDDILVGLDETPAPAETSRRKDTGGRGRKRRN